MTEKSQSKTCWRVGLSWGNAEAPEPTPGTTYLVATDREVVVSAIQSLYYPFGSGITEPKWGITFNNRASDFTTSPWRLTMRRRKRWSL
jgi:gamma-glutamyltranspeptidase/glutathione hydrolase